MAALQELRSADVVSQEETASEQVSTPDMGTTRSPFIASTACTASGHQRLK